MRLYDGNVVADPTLITMPDGTVISNPKEEHLLAAGYLPYIASPETPSTFSISKLKLVRKLRELGLEVIFDAALAANPVWQKDFTLSSTLESDDPILIAALPVLATAADMTEAAAFELLYSVRA